MAYTIDKAIIAAYDYLGIDENKVYIIPNTANRGIVYKFNDENIVIFIQPIGAKQGNSQIWLDTRDSGVDERKETWHYAKIHGFKYFLFAVNDENDRFVDYLLSLESNESAISEISFRTSAKTNSTGTQVNIPSSFIPKGKFSRIKTPKGFYISAVHKSYVLEYINLFDNRPYMGNIEDDESGEDDDNDWITDLISLEEYSNNLIVYGAPGTGKSHKIENEYLGKEFASSEYCRRVTFHPAYTYSQFFGTYKPVSKNDDDIAYNYVAGQFLDTILDAKKNPEQDYVLIIEEINRANVSAVFGDAFQLLDRDKTGKSEYEITVSDEIADYAEEKGVFLINNKLGIPSNMYIWATMNSADQGVMPLDTAFKRRWDFKYIGINDGEDEIKDCTFTINNKKVNWNSLRKHINSLMATAEINEDKWLGPFFISKHILDKGDFKDTFKSKVLMYLFEDSARYEMEFIIKENYQKDCKTLSGLFDAFEKHDVDIFVGSENIEIETITDGEQ